MAQEQDKVPVTVAQNQDIVVPFVQELMYPISDASSSLQSSYYNPTDNLRKVKAENWFSFF